jgi:hypothetical protein
MAAPLTPQPERVHPGVLTPSRRTAPATGAPGTAAASGPGLSPFPIQMSEDLLDDIEVLNACDNPHRTAAGWAGLDVDPEYAFQALRPDHRGKDYPSVRFSLVQQF